MGLKILRFSPKAGEPQGHGCFPTLHIRGSGGGKFRKAREEANKARPASYTIPYIKGKVFYGGITQRGDFLWNGAYSTGTVHSGAGQRYSLEPTAHRNGSRKLSWRKQHRAVCISLFSRESGRINLLSNMLKGNKT